MRENVPPFGVAVTYAQKGDRAQARALLKRMRANAQTSATASVGLAQVYAALGERDHAFEALERAFRGRANALLWLGYFTSFDSLRDDPRFADLLRRIAESSKS